MALLRAHRAQRLARHATLVAFWGVLAAVGLTRLSGQAVNDVYEVKAAFLYNFVKFVEWPPETFKQDSDAIRICLLGEDRIAAVLERTLKGKTFGGRAVTAVSITEPRQACDCQIVFIGTAEPKRLRPILLQVRALQVLTVGENPGFAEQGGVINLKEVDGKIALEINAGAAKRAKLHISSKLLQLARIVE